MPRSSAKLASQGTARSAEPTTPTHLVYDVDGLAKTLEATKPSYRFYEANAKQVPLADESVDLVVTSPPYWKKRDYGHDDQIGLERTPAAYVQNIEAVLRECMRVLAAHGSIFLNIGDTYHGRSLAGIPAAVEQSARELGLFVRNRIIWTKPNGMPEPARNRLANRHEYIMHFTKSDSYYYDLYAYANTFGNGANPGDVWDFPVVPGRGSHLAPFPEELVERCLVAACPPIVGVPSGRPATRRIEKTRQLDPNRPQAKRAMELAHAYGLTDRHIAAIRAVGITDVGKARVIQTGVDKNSKEVMRLAAEAKKVLGGYFREFTFAKKRTVAWDLAAGSKSYRRGVIFDPFVGTGTTLRVAHKYGMSGIGTDLVASEEISALPWVEMNP